MTKTAAPRRSHHRSPRRFMLALLLVGMLSPIALDTPQIAWAQPGPPEGSAFPPPQPEQPHRRIVDSLNDDEREAALNWAKTALPATYSFYERVQTVRLRVYLRGQMVSYYRRSKDSKSSEYPELTDLFDRECKDMDDLIVLGQRYTTADDKERETLQPKMKEKLGKIIVSRLKERRARIENLRQRLERQEKQLYAEESRVETTVDEQLRTITDRVKIVEFSPDAAEPTTQRSEAEASPEAATTQKSAEREAAARPGQQRPRRPRP